MFGAEVTSSSASNCPWTRGKDVNCTALAPLMNVPSHVALADARHALEEAQAAVDRLCRRWQELQAKCKVVA